MGQQTKFVLHGGFSPGGSQADDPFFSEMLRGTSKSPHILLVYFAKEADRVAKNMAEDKAESSRNQNGKDISFEIAALQGFEEQVNRADVVYFHGGQTRLLLEALKPFANLKELFKGKIIGGDSAGANVLCAAFYSMSMGAQEGFDIIPTKIMCHYQEENKHKLDRLRIELDTIYLPEYTMQVVTQ